MTFKKKLQTGKKVELTRKMDIQLKTKKYKDPIAEIKQKDQCF